MRIAYFDCFSGAGGDMIVAALIDAGADVARLLAQLATLQPARRADAGHAQSFHGYELDVNKITKQGFSATRFQVSLDPAVSQPHRHLKHVVEIICRADLPRCVQEPSIAVFTRLAEAEARVHGTTVEKVHFHEVGAIDAIVDVVAAVAALDLLNVDRVVCSPVPIGSGTIRCAHGLIPVPAPAVAELLKGIPIAACDETAELTTPTAAAILTTLADSFGPPPPMTLQSVGYGAGTRDGVTRPNVLRVLIGDANAPSDATFDQVSVLETNLDDATPQAIGHCLERLFTAGAWDAFTMPIQMKKCRPGVLLIVLCAPELADALEQVIFAETPTLGIRRRTEQRSRLPRRLETVRTEFGVIRVKIAVHGGVRTVSPEYEDCRAAAETHRIPLHQVIEAARTAAASIP